MNQADHIEKVIRAYYQELTRAGFSFELIAVVNGTTDNSFQICKKVALDLVNMRVYELKEGGYGRGVLYGLKQSRGKYLCYVNCARVYADELIACLKKFNKHSQTILHGVRIKRDSPLRKITSWIFNFGCWLLTGIYSKDLNGTPKIFSRQIYNTLQLKSLDSMIDLELLEKAKKNKIPIIETPIYKNIRHGGRSTSSWKTSLRLIRELISYRRSKN